MRKSEKVLIFLSKLRNMLKGFLRSSNAARGLRELTQRIQLSPSATGKLVARMQDLNIETVLDIGANVGQFGLDLRRHGFKGTIFSFEPIAEVALRLEGTAKRNPPWQVISLALGSKSELRQIHVARNSGLSSSFLEMLPAHLDAFPNSATASIQEVKVVTLDQITQDLGIDLDKTLIKIDVQGLESEVIAGGQSTISKVPLCYFEASILPLYRGEASILELLQEFSILGHKIIDLFRGVTDKSGNLLQVDILTSRLG